MAEAPVTLNPGSGGAQVRCETTANGVQQVVTLADSAGGFFTPAQDGVDGANPPTIPGAGIRGWLRSIYDKLAGTLTVAGTVAVSNLPATQPVSGTVAVNNFPASTAVSNFPATQPVSGTFFQATQPVSIAATAGTPKYYSGAAGTVTPLTGEVIRSITCHATTAGTLVIFGGPSIPLPANSTFYDSFLNEDERWVGDGAKTIVATGTDVYFIRVNT